jgi:hypothetical protein
MGSVVGIVDVRDEGDARLLVDLLFASRGQSKVIGMRTVRKKFLDWELFNLAIEEAGIRGVVEAGGGRLNGGGLRESWEEWKTTIEATSLAKHSTTTE